MTPLYKIGQLIGFDPADFNEIPWIVGFDGKAHNIESGEVRELDGHARVEGYCAGGLAAYLATGICFFEGYKGERQRVADQLAGLLVDLGFGEREE